MSEHADTIREALLCPEHMMRDCSPLLNGCSRVNQAHAALAALEAELAEARREVRHYAALELAYVELQAENARLRAALERIADPDQEVRRRKLGDMKLPYVIARAALASGCEGDTA